MGLPPIEFSQQIAGLVCGLLVVERLLMRERRGGVENVNRGGHIGMYQTNKLEITGGREHDIEGLARDHGRSADASGAIKRRRTDRETRTSDKKRRAHLSGSKECDGVDFVGANCPINGIAGVNPELIGKESNNLPPFVLALCCDRGLPGLGLD